MKIMPKVCILSSVHAALDNRIFYREALSLRNAGYDVAVIAIHPRDETVEGIPIRALPRVQRWQRPMTWRRLWALAIREDADIYHFHDPELLPIGARLRRMGRQTIYDIHESNAEFILIKEHVPKALRHIVANGFGRSESWLAGQQSALIFADDMIAKQFSAINLPQTTLFNFPSVEFIRDAQQAKCKRDDEGPMILHLGGHKLGRGVHLMIEAFAYVHSVMPTARLSLVGPFHPPAFEEEIHTLVHAKGLDHAVSITGGIPFAEVGDYLFRASIGWIALQPVAKYLKNIPTKLFEYMAYDIPVISSDLPPIRQFMHNGETGFLVSPSQSQAHAKAILTILNQPHLAKTMGEAGKELVQSQYNWQQMERRLLHLYAGLLA